MTRNSSYGVTLVLSGASLFVVNAGVSRVALRAGVEPGTLTTARVTGTLVVMVVVAACFNRSALRPPTGRMALLVVAHGLVGIAALQWTYFVAIERLPVGMALLLEYQAPILVALWARFVQKEHVRNQAWLGLGLAMAGLAASTGIWNGLSLDGVGIMAGLAAAVCFAAYFLIGEIGVNTISPLQLVVWSFLCAAVVLNVVAPVWHVGHLVDDHASLLGRLDSHTAPVWAILGWVIVLGTVLPFFSELVALQHLKATTVTVIAMLEPVGAVALGWVWFRESLDTIAVIGCVAVVTGVLLAQTARATAPAEPVLT
jgi:drug/metabolite transporter (DMT)-like permease